MVVVVALNEAARNAGLNGAALVNQFLGGRGGGSPEPAQGGTPPRCPVSSPR
ncbi:hypothetical protein [Streptomyces sp. SHP 1-2]|uniref:hypothetical protein n=1 Tax=Streptomyces sp. SHP 1-2 TaxID=2769489 RepID=UPI002237B26A|nr:hypothetical protein [Streptomyces sp. SHP 1-2]MCW5251951.1 hypothetical protein [Streptomyces sp. SHP 1-2]